MRTARIALAIAGLLVGMGIVMDAQKKRQNRKTRRALRRRYSDIESIWVIESL